MGWMKTLLLGDVGLRLDLDETEDKLAVLQHQQKSHQEGRRSQTLEIAILKAELEKQRLATAALSRFFVEKNMIDAKELEDFIQEIDAEDGVVDGRLAIEPQKRRLIFKTPANGL